MSDRQVDTIKSKKQLANHLDYIQRQIGHGSRNQTYAELLGGFNHRLPGTLALNNKDNQGYVFFTRPCLNLTYSNLSKVREFLPFRDATPESLLRAARCYLDPWSQRIAEQFVDEYDKTRPLQPVAIGQVAGREPHLEHYLCRSNWVDPYSPFINVLSNTLLSLSGWPDPVMDYMTTDAGRMGEQIAYANGVYQRYGTYELSGTFRNTEGNILPLMFGLWVQYMGEVLIGRMVPYMDKIVRREYDYNTRVYRFVMDPSKKYITMFAATGASFPINNPLGSIFNYDSDRPLSDGNQTLSYSFKCIGATYNDNIILEEFNRLTAIFNPELRIKKDSNGMDMINARGDNILEFGERYHKLRDNELQFFNNARDCYPLINRHTMELEWWIRENRYRELETLYNGL